MTHTHSRVARLGALTIVLSLAVALAGGGVADAAKKKKKQKSVNSITIGTTAPTVVGPKASNDSTDTIAQVPLVVGKKAKGKVVGWDSLTVTSTFSSDTTDNLGQLYALVTAPNGRTVFLENPFASAAAGNVTSGPLTESPDSPFDICTTNATHPTCPGGAQEFPFSTVGPPFVGTIRNPELTQFGGVPAQGTWTVSVLNGGIGAPGTMNSISLTMTLKTAPV